MDSCTRHICRSQSEAHKNQAYTSTYLLWGEGHHDTPPRGRRKLIVRLWRMNSSELVLALGRWSAGSRSGHSCSLASLYCSMHEVGAVVTFLQRLFAPLSEVIVSLIYCLFLLVRMEWRNGYRFCLISGCFLYCWETQVNLIIWICRVEGNHHLCLKQMIFQGIQLLKIALFQILMNEIYSIDRLFRLWRIVTIPEFHCPWWTKI